MGNRLRSLVTALLAAGALAGCPSKPKPDPARPPAQVDASTVATEPTRARSDAAHGKELVLSFQCNRCHDGTGHPAAEPGKHCVHCHQDIVEDRFKASAASITRWKPRVRELTDAPSLEATGKRLRRSWIESYLLTPVDLRPQLHASMPRLALTQADARDIAAYLAPDVDLPTQPVARADLGKGRHLLETKGCASCHSFSGVAALVVGPPPPMDAKNFDHGRKLAPDLRFARDRMTAARMSAWLSDPRAIKPDTPMPKVALSQTEIRDLVGYIQDVELAASPPKTRPQRLPVLARKVAFKEVDEKVFHRTCWHCHSEPDYAIGDGGPGNSGGFGFRPRGLNLSDYNGIAAGYLDDKGERASVFARDAANVPRIVLALMARYDEESGAETGAVRGMPLGYDPVSLEDVQLVESWVAQGRPR